MGLMDRIKKVTGTNDAYDEAYDDDYYGGFDGYNEDVTKKWPHGKPNSMIARSIEGGTSWKAKHPFIAPAVRSSRDAAEKAMAEEIEKSIQETMG